MLFTLYRWSRRKINSTPRQKFYPDELPDTLDYVKRVQRVDPMGEAFTESSACPARPGITIDWSDSDKAIKMNLEYGRRSR